jgi:hypothetical protein
MIKHLHELRKDVHKAMKWAAAEYDYLEKLKEEIEQIEGENDPQKEKKELRNAVRILLYISSAERRAFRFEEEVERDLKQVYKELSQYVNGRVPDELHFDYVSLHKLMQLVREIDIEHKAIVKYTARYEGLLSQDIKAAEAEIQLLADMESGTPEAEKLHTSFITAVEKVRKEIKDVEQWIMSLEATLERIKNASSVLKYVEEMVQHPEKVGFTVNKVRFTLEGYGFPRNEWVTIQPERVPLPLPPRAERMYGRILHSSRYNLNELLEQVASIVNDSMAYDFARATVKDKRMSGYWERLKEKTKKSSTTLKGVCTDAGIIIRAIIHNLHLPKEYGFRVAATTGEVIHDLTIVFNRNSKRWVLINSKSPTKKYYLVPKEQVLWLGRLYTATINDKSSPYYKLIKQYDWA